ncbi:uncharacterized protein N7515_001527 [Penicillium bovifimosum]|uniref:Uncharacterized protein n=1 Tax=Penicillium bovifimosum TaxID=126998 RepID=A0A9W9L774_9EURO|nr:uncharacterized protein N7515_001527 [Penicillium bovifimosum]KAJ5142740.1 hypothetical protein N7515_001527 [Penicillium bovifimosum]
MQATAGRRMGVHSEMPYSFPGTAWQKTMGGHGQSRVSKCVLVVDERVKAIWSPMLLHTYDV